jgi:hypothetical protein
MREYTRRTEEKPFPFHVVWLAQNWIGQSDYLATDVRKKLLTMSKFIVRLGWINTMAKCLATSQSEHGWRAPINGLSHSGWNVLGQTFLYVRIILIIYSVQCQISCFGWNCANYCLYQNPTFESRLREPSTPCTQITVSKFS